MNMTAFVNRRTRWHRWHMNRMADSSSGHRSPGTRHRGRRTFRRIDIRHHDWIAACDCRTPCPTLRAELDNHYIRSPPNLHGVPAMSRVFENQTFERFFEDGCGAVYSDFVFRRCTFVNCAVSITRNPALRTTVRNVQIIDCVRKRDPAGFPCAIVEDCLIENLKIEELLQTWGAAFKHVTLRGKIGPLMLSNCLCPTSTTTDAMQRAFEEANTAYYANVDWALDISKAEFTEDCDIRGIPARLIRRDPDTQVVITRERAMRGEWRNLDLHQTYWRAGIEFMLERGDADVVLVAPKRAKDFEHLLRGLQLLREAGVAEPD